MTKDESLAVTAHIARVIAENAPRIDYSEADLLRAREGYSEEKLAQLARDGFYKGDFELFYMMLRFCDGMDLWDRADEAYLQKLFSEAKRLDPKEFFADPYLATVPIRERRIGKILLTEAHYERGEYFQYDMPRLDEELVVPRIGFFPKKVRFPAVYEGNVPWVSVCPSEVYSMTPDVADAHGRVLVLGLGLGYYPFHVSLIDKVREITVVEKSPEILKIFREELLPHFPKKEKIRLVEADAFRFMEEVENGRYDFCYADIWEGWVDGAACYEKLLPHEKRLFDCEFRYWIRDEIRWYLAREKR
ncbi:MAG: hypothetical protein IKC69_01525 [Clostridia bacterium]|nr:hypothetical protein [Clostridia bacterium]